MGYAANWPHRSPIGYTARLCMTASRHDRTKPGRGRPGAGRRVKKPVRIIGGVLITLFFLWLAVRNVDIAAIRDALRHASYRYLIPAAIFCAIGYLLRTLRWQRILAPTTPVSFSRLFPVLMVGFAANNL